jgi:hypothetical protein
MLRRLTLLVLGFLLVYAPLCTLNLLHTRAEVRQLETALASIRSDIDGWWLNCPDPTYQASERGKCILSDRPRRGLWSRRAQLGPDFDLPADHLPVQR